jgi:hypothetical protein
VEYLRWLVGIFEYLWPALIVLGLASPFILLWGWVKYLDVQPRSDWRSRASFVGLSSPILSGLLLTWAKNWHSPAPTMRYVTMVGVWIPVVGMLVGLAGRPRLILAIVPASIGAVLFWVTTTLP